MGAELISLAAFFGLTGFFATIGAVLAGWMVWRIVEKAGVPGWVGLGAVLLTLTGIGTIVPLILLWIFAYMRWPRDARETVSVSYASYGAPLAPPQGVLPPPTVVQALPPPPVVQALSPPAAALADRRLWQLSGSLSNGQAVVLAFEPASGNYLLTGAPSMGSSELSLPDPSVGHPHARLLTSGSRLGIEDLGTPGGTWVDGARLGPEHGPRDIGQVRRLKLGAVELSLSRG